MLPDHLLHTLLTIYSTLFTTFFCTPFTIFLHTLCNLCCAVFLTFASNGLKHFLLQTFPNTVNTVETFAGPSLITCCPCSIHLAAGSNICCALLKISPVRPYRNVCCSLLKKMAGYCKKSICCTCSNQWLPLVKTFASHVRYTRLLFVIKFALPVSQRLLPTYILLGYKFVKESSKYAQLNFFVTHCIGISEKVLINHFFSAVKH